MSEYIFTSDWFSGNIPIWSLVLENLKHKPDLRFLEVGSYQGRSTVWLLENVLTHPSSKIICIDTFEGSIENTADEKKDLLDIFRHNVSGFGEKVDTMIGYSQTLLRVLHVETFDFIYIDGDHHAASVLEDAVLAFPLLKPGGVLIFDDYEWTTMEHEIQRPKIAIDAFVNIYQNKLNIVHRGYQVVVQKL